MFIALFSIAGTSYADEFTKPYDFVSEIIRELDHNEAIKMAGVEELKEAQASGNNMEIMSAIIRQSTRQNLELRTNISMLKGMHLKAPSDNSPKMFADIYQQKIELYEMMSDIAEKFMSGPKPGVDFGNLAAQMPKITAMLEQNDNSLIKVSPSLFIALIDMKEDSQGHANHLVISKKERQKLLSELKKHFGERMKMKNQDGLVSAASVLTSYLENKGFKNAEDPY